MNPELRALSSFVAMTSLLALPACSDSYSSVAAATVAAKVNGAEIGVRQINPPLLAGPAARQALDRLIDQELLAQKAVEKRLDHDPAVLREIADAKHKILARSYVDRSIPNQTVSPAEIGDFYRRHPALFEQRHIYRFNELIAVLGPDDLPALNRQLASSGKLDDLAAWLQSRHLPFQRNATIKSAEQIPPDLLPRIAAMQVGETAIFVGSAAVSVVYLEQVQPAPLSQKEAQTAIEKRLLDEKRQTFAEARAKQLRTQARIEYLGPFAEAGDSPPTPVGKVPVDKREAHLIKGLSGLF